MNLSKEQWSGWSDWFLLTEVDLKNIPTNAAGAYVISCSQELARAHGIDEQGILDIGESNSLRSRINAFKRCATGDSKKGHMAGWRYFQLGFDTIYPFDSLWICYRTCIDKEAAYLEEGRLLRAYVAQHYELPPLNYKFNWSEDIELKNR